MATEQTNLRLSKKTKQTIKDIRKIKKFKSDAEVVAEGVALYKTKILNEMAKELLDKNPIVRRS